MDKNVDILVIGAGQAGLAMGYYLKQSDFNFMLLDSSARIGDAWRNRYDSLILFSPRNYSCLPGLSLSGDPEGYPPKDELANYLETYAHTFSIPVGLNTEVKSLEKMGERFKAITPNGEYSADKIVIATGPFQKPFLPQIQQHVSDNVFQIHSSKYKNPSQLPAGNVLVIGAGNSGAQIATELSHTRKVYLSTGHDIIFLRREILGRSIFWWLDKLHLSEIPVDSKISKFFKKSEPVIGSELKNLIQEEKVIVKERTVGFIGQNAVFQDESQIAVDNIIWATGFSSDYSWVHVQGVINQDNKPIHQRGISPVRGIYFLGLLWLSRLGSTQLNGVGYDAKHLYEHIKKSDQSNT